jgi:methyl-accepting chemotaxis protein
MARLRLTIQLKIVLTLAILMVICGALISGTAALVAKKVSASLGSGLANDAAGTAHRISANLFERYGDVQAFALNPAAADTANWGKFDESSPIVRSMNSYVRLYGMYSLTVLVDNTGKVVAVNTRDAAGKPINTESLHNANFANTDWFKDAVAGRFYEGPDSTISGTVISDLHKCDEVASVYKNSGTSIAFAAPVKNDKGEVIGVWRNIASTDFIAAILLDVRLEARESGKGSTQVSLVDKDGHLWLNTEGAEDVAGTVRDGRENLLAGKSEAATLALKGEGGFLFGQKDTDSDRSLAIGFNGRHPDQGFSGMNWGILLQVEDSEARALEYAFIQTIGVGLLIAGVICIGGVVLSTRFLLAPIRDMAQRMQEIATGDGDLTQRMDENRGDEMGDVARSFNLFTESMRRVIANVLDSATEVAAAATQIAATTESLANGINSQQSKTSQISAAVEESTSSTREVARQAHDATSAATAAGQEAASGGREVEQTVGVIERVASEVEAVATAIEALGGRSEEIGTIVGVISDIAEQTNLLALNAAIEAARAGEHGRGFAVVADEVRKLAERTQSATSEIAQSIKAIQTDTSSAVERMKIGNEEVRGSVTQARKAGETLSRIVHSSSDVSERIKAIAASAEQQTQAIEEISGAVTAIAEITNQFSSSSVETVQATSALSQKAEVLQNLVQKFKVEQRVAERYTTDQVKSSRGKVLDVSSGGVRIQFSGSETLNEGESLTLSAGGHNVSVPVQPRWKRNTPGGVQVGVQFNQRPAALSEVVDVARRSATNVRQARKSPKAKAGSFGGK